MARPRTEPTGSFSTGALLGALYGGLLSRSPAGALVGGTVGGVLTAPRKAQPLPLEEAIQKLVEERGFKFVGFHRLGSHGGKLSIRTPEMYRMLSAKVPGHLEDRDEIDDLIFDDLDQQLGSVTSSARVG